MATTDLAARVRRRRVARVMAAVTQLGYTPRQGLHLQRIRHALQVRGSFNLDLRVRETRLVNIEFEAGAGLPLDHDGGRFCCSRYGF